MPARVIWVRSNIEPPFWQSLPVFSSMPTVHPESERFRPPPAIARQARLGAAVVAAVGIGIGVAAWLGLPSATGIEGAFLTLWKLLITAAGAAFVGVAAWFGASRLELSVDRHRHRLLLQRRILGWTSTRSIELRELRQVQLVQANDTDPKGPAYLNLYLESQNVPVSFGFPFRASALRSAMAWMRDHLDLLPDAYVGLTAGPATPPPPRTSGPPRPCPC